MDQNFIISDVAEGIVEPVNITQMFTFRKQDPTRLSPSTELHAIAFYKADAYLDQVPLKWDYASKEARDCDYNKIVKLVARSINEAEEVFKTH